MTHDHLEFRSGLAAARLLRLGAVATFVLGGSALMLISTPAQAVPSFARQTGLACEACHTIPPELTPFGRRFRLNAYTMTTKSPLVSDIDDHKRNTVWLTDIPGISILLQSTYDHWDRPLPDSLVPGAKSQSDTLQFPQQMSIMYAGAISDHFGAWLQLTYLQNTGSLGIDNNDVRYSDHTENNDWVWGLTLNNNPSFQDVWNTGEAYGIPYFPVQSLYSATQPLGNAGLRGPLFTQFPGLAAGLGAYVWYKDSFYLELSQYHAAKSGSAIANEDSSNLNVGGGTIESFAPYWRAAYERDWGYNSAMIGTSGMYVRFVPSVFAGQTLSPGNANRYLDLSFDWQYQYNGQHNIFTFLGHYTHEHQENDPGLVPTYFSNSTDQLNQLQVTGEYYYNRHYGGLVSFRRTTGTTDVAFNGGSGSPANQFEVFELDYLPWFNAKLLLQYVVYNVVNNNQNPFFLAGASNPKASNNNTVVVGLWMDF
ncbi:MAG: hypothetical protein WA446_16610 [Steroidobacteraceae bacterium]